MKLLWLVKSALCGGLVGLCVSVTAQDHPDDIAVISERRVRDLAQFADPSSFNNILTWLAAQRDDGTWADVDYATGCAASAFLHVTSYHEAC